MGCCFSTDNDTSPSTELSSISAPSPPVPIRQTHASNCTCKQKSHVNQLQHKNGGKWAVAGLDFVLEQDRVYYEVQLGPDFKGTVRVGVYRHEKKGISKLAKAVNDEKGEINMKSLGVYGCTFQGLHPNAVIGVTVGFSDIPVVVYRVNGEVVSQHVSKVRGNVSPFVAWEGGGIGVAFEEKGWKGQCSRGADGVIRASNLI